MTALTAAVAVAKAQRKSVDIRDLEDWIRRKSDSEPSGQRKKFQQFSTASIGRTGTSAGSKVMLLCEAASPVAHFDCSRGLGWNRGRVRGIIQPR